MRTFAAILAWCAAASAQTIAITGGTVVDGNGGAAKPGQPGRGELDRLRLAVRPQHLDHRGTLVSTAGREPVACPRQQDGQEVGCPLRGVVHAAAEQRRLTGHE